MKKPTLLLFALVLSIAPVPLAAEGHPESHNVAQMNLVKFPGFPTCATGSVQSGDPSKGPSIIYTRIATGCVIPWHWHTPTEQLMMVSGVAHIDVKDEKAVTLKAGGYAELPSHHQHQYTCLSTCTMYVHSDAPFDIHYVDKSGNELSPEEALKKVKEKTIKPSE